MPDRRTNGAPSEESVSANDGPLVCRASDPNTWPAEEREQALAEGWIIECVS
jgi:hypothetical protein